MRLPDLVGKASRPSPPTRQEVTEEPVGVRTDHLFREAQVRTDDPVPLAHPRGNVASREVVLREPVQEDDRTTTSPDGHMQLSAHSADVLR
jgi:hypothetical protein